MGIRPGCGGCEARLLEAIQGEGRALEARWEVRDLDSPLTLVREGRGVSVLGEGALPDDSRGLVLRRISPERFRTLAPAVRPEDAGRATLRALLAAAESFGAGAMRLRGRPRGRRPRLARIAARGDRRIRASSHGE